MNKGRWVWVPIRLGLLAVAAGIVVIVVLWFGAGNQRFATTQLPYVLVAGGAGVGLVAVGSTLVAAQRLRLDQRHVEDAVARVLTSAARLAGVRDRVRQPGDLGPDGQPR